MEAKNLTVVETARLLRNALRNEFPDVKFSIRSKSYAGGASIDVEFYGYPTEQEVKEIARSYEGAGFDSMSDMKYYKEHFLLPSGESILAHRPAFYGAEEYDAPVPTTSQNIILVQHGADFIFVRKKGEVDPACVIKKGRSPSKKKKKIQGYEPLDISELIKK